MTIPTYRLKIGNAVPSVKENIHEIINSDFLFRQYVRILELVPFSYFLSVIVFVST